MVPLESIKIEGITTIPTWIIVKNNRQVELPNGKTCYGSKVAAELAIRNTFKDTDGEYSVVKCHLVPTELESTYDSAYSFLFHMDRMDPRQAALFVQREMKKHEKRTE